VDVTGGAGGDGNKNGGDAPPSSGGGGGGAGFYSDSYRQFGIGGKGGSGMLHVIYWNQHAANQVDDFVRQMNEKLGQLAGTIAGSQAFADHVLKSDQFDRAVKAKVDAYLKEIDKGRAP
jgi:hypothetical protein